MASIEAFRTESVKNVLRYCKDEKTRHKLQNLLIYVLNIDNESRFDKEYPQLLVVMKTINENFHRYFIRVYDNCRSKWALFARLNAPYQTNNLCESWFSCFKRVYLKNNTQNRIDLLVEKLFTIVDQKYIENKRQLLLPFKTNQSHRQKVSESNHTKLFSLDKLQFQEIAKNKFKYKGYEIEYVSEICEHGCNDECSFCHICNHRVVCSCTYFRQKRYICKHIHLVFSCFINVRNNKKPKTDTSIVTNPLQTKIDIDRQGENCKKKLERIENIENIDDNEINTVGEKLAIKDDLIKRKLKTIATISSSNARLEILDFIDNGLDVMLKKIDGRLKSISLFSNKEFETKRKGIPQKKIDSLLFKPKKFEAIKMAVRGRQENKRFTDKDCCKVCFLTVCESPDLITNWISCGLCENWYHIPCLETQPMDGSDD